MSVTVILAVAFLDPVLVVQVIVVVPAAFAVTLPVLDTVATLVLLDFHVTVLSVALLGATVAVNWSVLPFRIDALVLFKETFVGTIWVTVTLKETFSLGSVLFATVIVNVPAFLPVTTPLVLTVAILVSLDVHFYDEFSGMYLFPSTLFVDTTGFTVLPTVTE